VARLVTELRRAIDALAAPILTKPMAIVRTVSLSLAVIAVFIFGGGMDIEQQDRGALCGGRPYARMSVPEGASPYVDLTADGIKGPFLLDYGATRSSLSAAAFPRSDGSIRTAAISLPGIESADFHLARYDLLLQPKKGQLGVIGDDLLSRLTVQLSGNVAYLGAESCRPEALVARSLTPVAQNGFFSSDPSKIKAGLPNVPVVFLRLGEVRAWAQIDTGYEDAVYPRSVDVNQALFDRLVRSGVKINHVDDIDVWTCDGREGRPVYQVEDRPLTIETEQGKAIVETKDFHLVVKPANACGGIADFPEPAAQLGASFLRLFRVIIFDPKNATVWLDGAGKTANQ
jgi:hypothetical protein